MKSIAFGQTNSGRRRRLNEDAFLVDDELQLYAVCDGIGGHAAGDIASGEAIHAVVNHLRGTGDRLTQLRHGSDDDVQEALDLANEAVQSACAHVFTLALSQPEYAGMGTTLTMLLVLDSVAVMAHVGDSRLYRLRNGEIHQLSEDHTVLQDLARCDRAREAGLLGDRLSHVLTRAVGVRKSVRVDRLSVRLRRGDKFILATDGLTGMVEDAAEIQAVVRNTELCLVPERLIELANARGGQDNITVVAVSINGA